MHRRRIYLQVVAVCSLGLGACAAGAPGQLDEAPALLDDSEHVAAEPVPVSQPPASRHVQEQALRIARFDHDVAAQNGYAIVQLPDGSVASVPAERTNEARAGEYRPERAVLPSPDSPELYAIDTAEGNCGGSFIDFSALGNSEAELVTGFAVEAPIWDLNWNVDILDRGGRSTQHFEQSDGFMEGPSGWRSRFRTLRLTPGPAEASVALITSFAILEDGSVCFSYGPSVEIVIE